MSVSTSAGLPIGLLHYYARWLTQWSVFFMETKLLVYALNCVSCKGTNATDGHTQNWKQLYGRKDHSNKNVRKASIRSVTLLVFFSSYVILCARGLTQLWCHVDAMVRRRTRPLLTSVCLFFNVPVSLLHYTWSLSRGGSSKWFVHVACSRVSLLALRKRVQMLCVVCRVWRIRIGIRIMIRHRIRNRNRNKNTNRRQGI